LTSAARGSSSALASARGRRRFHRNPGSVTDRGRCFEPPICRLQHMIAELSGSKSTRAGG
jgi:hypothetical protein